MRGMMTFIFGLLCGVVLHSLGTDEIKAEAETIPEVKVITIEIETPPEEKSEIECEYLDMLALCVEAEAGNQDKLGKRLVCDVILNRVDSEHFPNDIRSVIYQPTQFSVVWDGSMERIGKASEETIELCKMELEHRTDTEIMFFGANGFSKFGNKAYKHSDHYFSYWRDIK